MARAVIALTFAVLTLADAPPAAAQAGRLRELDPAMAVQAFGRAGACDVLLFTPDGGQLLGVGDDKVLHRWATAGGRLRYLDPHRWNTFRETRGAIYAAALSPDASLVAVAGYGRLTSDVSILSRTGDIVHGLSAATHPDYKSGEAVWALAFDRDGRRLAVGHDDGSVWVWDVKANTVHAAARAKAVRAEGGTRVLWVGFDGDRLRFVRADGGVFDLPATARGEDPAARWKFENGPLYQVRASADAKTFVACPLKQTADGSAVEVRDRDGRDRGRIAYNRERVVNRVAVDASGQRVAVGLKNSAQEGRTFFQWADGAVEVFDLTGPRPRKIAATTDLTTAPEALAFDPTGTRLAVAAGADHETSLWAVDGTALKPTDVHAGVGSSIWGLRVSADGFRVGFQDKKAATPKHPNARGDGPWRVFDLKARKWLRTPPPDGTALAAANGWTVEFDPADEAKWTLVSADRDFAYPIPLDPLRDEKPTCYTFLPAAPDSARVRLAVGHYWGFSVFEAGPGERPRRVRCASGHAGFVTAIVPAADGKLLFTASRDHTIAVWSTDDWKHQGELGAAFAADGDKLVVQAVEPGSPAWEAGLLPRDRIGQLFFDKTEVTKPADRGERVATPEPGKELAFVGTRPGTDVPVQAKTLLYQRPQWRFFATRDEEWVLSRYQDFYYDCSANGDTYLGWLVGGKTAAASPQFHPAERFRKLFHRPAKVQELLDRFTRTPGEPFSPDVLPPTIAAKLSPPAADGSVELDFVVTPRKKFTAPEQAIPLEKVELWLGDTDNLDHLLWEQVPKHPADVFAPLPLKISADLLRAGANRLVVVAYVQGVRTERAIDFDSKLSVKRARRLFGLVVGIDAYPGGRWKKLDASVTDAKAVHESFTSLADAGFFDAVQFGEPLLNEQATPDAILGAIDKLAAEAGPDDWVMVFLAGHGHGKVKNGVVEPGTWYFVGYNAGAGAVEVPGKAIFDRLKAAKGRKLIFLDACHSGAADESRVGDGARDLRPDGKGPVVLTAAAPDQSAWEAVLPTGGRLVSRGFFSTGLSESLSSRRADADRDADGVLTVGEVFLFTRNRVRQLVQQYEKPPQTVQMSPNPLWGLPVSRVKRDGK